VNNLISYFRPYWRERVRDLLTLVFREGVRSKQNLVDLMKRFGVVIKVTSDKIDVEQFENFLRQLDPNLRILKPDFVEFLTESYHLTVMQKQFSYKDLILELLMDAKNMEMDASDLWVLEGK
jgi:hypothetical protein